MKKLLYILVFIFFASSVVAYEYKSKLGITFNVSDEFFIVSGIDVDSYIKQLEKKFPGKYNTQEMREEFNRIQGLSEDVENSTILQQ